MNPSVVEMGGCAGMPPRSARELQVPGKPLTRRPGGADLLGRATSGDCTRWCGSRTRRCQAPEHYRPCPKPSFRCSIPERRTPGRRLMDSTGTQALTARWPNRAPSAPRPTWADQLPRGQTLKALRYSTAPVHTGCAGKTWSSPVAARTDHAAAPSGVKFLGRRSRSVF